MSMRTGNATRDRLLADRDAFRASLQAPVPQPNVQQTAPQPNVQQNVQPNVQQQVAPQPDVQQVPPQDIQVPDDFIHSVNVMGNTAAQQPQSQPSQNDDLDTMRGENDKLKKELEELRKAREADMASLKELNELREKQRVDKYLAEMDGLGTINGDDARKLVSPLLQRLEQTKADNAKQLQDVQASIDKRLSELDKRNTQNKVNQMYAKILKAHPDLKQLQRSQAYNDVMTSPVQEGSAITVGEFVAAEIKNGNADYIIKVLDTVKQRSSLPDISNIASVSSNAPVSGAASDANANGESLTPDQIANYRFKVQTGEMSRDEFRQIMARHREASKLR